MIEIHVKKLLQCPTLVCDICGEELTAVGKAAAVYPNWKPDGSKVPVLFVHKGKIDDRDCHAEADRRIEAQGESPGWQGLRTFLVQLAHNVSFPPADMVKAESNDAAG